MSDSFAHRLKIADSVDGQQLDLVADDQERAAIRERLGLEQLDRLEAHATLDRTGALQLRVRGRLRAALSQSCVVTGEPVAAHIDEPFEVIFAPEPSAAADEEIELGEEDCDVVFHDGSTIDLGAAIADSLALALNPYPRSAAAETASREAGVVSEAEASPFAVLARLKGSGSGGEGS